MNIGIRKARKIVRDEVATLKSSWSYGMKTLVTKITTDAGVFPIYYNGNVLNFEPLNRKKLESAIAESKTVEAAA